MDSIKSLINNNDHTPKGIIRFKYMPYNSVFAKHVWFGIVKQIFDIKDNEFKPGEQQAKIWEQFIKYVHGDDSCVFDLTKSICICGQTGSGKSKTMDVLNQYIQIDNVHYRRDNKKIPLKFRMVSSKEIVSDYTLHGYDGIVKYLIIGNLCIDDLGDEIKEPQHFGNKLDVISEIIEIRYNKGFLTHFTTNLFEDEILDRYNSRVHSRMVHSCNMIIMNDKDFRI